MPPRVLLVDNYDSFTWNLAQYLGMAGADVAVRRNDAVSLDEVRAMDPTHVVLSPGPGRPDRPADFGVCWHILEHLTDRPLLGVCLGHQGLAAQQGAAVVRAPQVMHGKTSPIHHHRRGLFAGLPEPLTVMRYHSLVVDRSTLPPTLEVTAETEDGLVMALADRQRPRVGVQFHPESIGTPDGLLLLANFLGASTSRGPLF